MNRKLREKLASLEHNQWAHWYIHMRDHMTPENIERWNRQASTPYSKLTEKEKEADRFWADKVLCLLED